MTTATLAEILQIRPTIRQAEINNIQTWATAKGVSVILTFLSYQSLRPSTQSCQIQSWFTSPSPRLRSQVQFQVSTDLDKVVQSKSKSSPESPISGLQSYTVLVHQSKSKSRTWTSGLGQLCFLLSVHSWDLSPSPISSP